MGKKQEEEEGGGGAWLISYADLMTLLFAAFVVLYGITPQGEGEVIRLVGAVSSIREAFVEVPDDIPVEQRKGPILIGKAVFKQFKGDSLVEPVIKRFRRSVNALNIINADVDQIQALIKSLSDNDPQKKSSIEVIKQADGIRIRLLASQFYDKGAYRIRRKQLRKIQQIGELIAALDQRISIEGHTQSVPESKIYSNWEPSALRASFVARYLITKSGFPPQQITASGYADTKPIARTLDAKDEQMNRRVEIKIQYDE